MAQHSNAQAKSALKRRIAGETKRALAHNAQRVMAQQATRAKEERIPEASPGRKRVLKEITLVQDMGNILYTFIPHKGEMIVQKYKSYDFQAERVMPAGKALEYFERLRTEQGFLIVGMEAELEVYYT